MARTLNIPSATAALTGLWHQKSMRRYSKLSAILVAAAVFAITLMSRKHDAFGVLYVIVIVLLADDISLKKLKIVGVGCIFATLLSFFLRHYDEPFSGAYARVVLSVISIFIVTSLTIRHKIATETLSEHARILAHADRIATLGYLVATVGHEVNQPLSSIMTFAQSGKRWLDRDNPDIEEAISCLANIEVHIDRSSRVINNINRLVKSDTSQRGYIDLKKYITEVAQILRFELNESGIDFNIQTELDEIIIFGNSIEIQQVFFNLLFNSIQSIKISNQKNGFINIIISENNPKSVYQINVIDSGVGFSGVDSSRLFEPFFTTKSEGLGMGLAIVRSIIDAHAGKIFANEQPPSGASISIELPMVKPNT